MPNISLEPPWTPAQSPLGAQRTQLLVSVQNASEARLARQLGVDWIDLKNPQAGPLGAASGDTARTVAEQLAGFPQRSAAAGELRSEAVCPALQLAPYFPFIKVGLAGQKHCATWTAQIKRLAEQLAAVSSVLIPVIYADHDECNAPDPRAIIEMGAGISAPYILIDTFHKDGRRLLDWMPVEQLTEWIELANTINSRIVIAGSLSLSDMPQIANLPVAAIAVRGAVCSGHRNSGLCAKKVEQWVSLVRKTSITGAQTNIAGVFL